MKKRNQLFLFGGMVLVLMLMALSACSTKTPTAEVVESSEVASVGEVGSGVGTISGELSFPGETMPSQRVIAFNITDPSIYYYIEIADGGSYSLEIPAGMYVVLSYPIDPILAGTKPNQWGAYSKAVACGLTDDCTDHGLKPVSVDVGEDVTGINPIDWNEEAGLALNWPVDPENSDNGSISGNLGYPSEAIPPLRIVAFDTNSDEFFYTDTVLNQTEFQLTGIPAGTYQVVAYLLEDENHMSGGYSFFVTCGLSVNCSDHNLIDVLVYPGLDTFNINPVDWYSMPTDARWPVFPNP